MIPCRAKRGLFDRWYLFHLTDDHLAWSGSRWVGAEADGQPHQVQVCNFDTKDSAAKYAKEHDLMIVD